MVTRSTTVDAEICVATFGKPLDARDFHVPSASARQLLSTSGHWRTLECRHWPIWRWKRAFSIAATPAAVRGSEF